MLGKSRDRPPPWSDWDWALPRQSMASACVFFFPKKCAPCLGSTDIMSEILVFTIIIAAAVVSHMERSLVVHCLDIFP